MKLSELKERVIAIRGKEEWERLKIYKKYLEILEESYKEVKGKVLI